jgi:hypothetical protein
MDAIHAILRDFAGIRKLGRRTHGHHKMLDFSPVVQVIGSAMRKL